MRSIILSARACFAAALIVYGIQHFYFGTFRDVFFSPYQKFLPALAVWAYIFGAYLVLTGGLIFTFKYGRLAAQVLGIVLLLLFLTAHLPYMLISEPNSRHLGMWTTPLKTLALAGASFIVAYSYGSASGVKKNFLNGITPYGNIFFLYTLTSFGISHIMYAKYMTSTVPAWMPDQQFWVVFAGVTLASGGIAMFLGIRIRAVALLMALQIFLWVWMVHVPGTLSRPLAKDRGNLLASTFDALAFSSAALLISLTMKKQQWVEDLNEWGTPASSDNKS